MGTYFQEKGSSDSELSNKLSFAYKGDMDEPGNDVGQLCRPAQEEYKGSDPLIGRIIDGKYVLESLISRGGMGSVYCARRQQIGDLVAVKVLKIDESLEPVSLKRFKLEAASAASIKHQNVVAIHDFGLLDDIAYLVMERLEGPSLGSELSSYGPCSLERAIRIFNQISAAISAAHKQGIIHRDLKPSNIIFQHPNCVDDLIKVVDFGLAKLIRGQSSAEKLTVADYAVGTPAYMSPEQCLGTRIAEYSDIYALGVVLYEILTGEVPFHDFAVSAVMIQHVTKAPRSMRSIDPDIPEQVDAVVLKALQKNPERRYRSAMEMATEFEVACRNAVLAKRLKEKAEVKGAQTDSLSLTLTEMAIMLRDRPEDLIGDDVAYITSEGMKVATRAAAPVRFSFERFIGRDEEIRQMQERLEQVRTGTGRALFLIGDPGVGKTELVNRFQQSLSPAATHFLTGKFYEYGSGGPYRPYLDSLHSFVRSNQKFSSEGWAQNDPNELTSQLDRGLDEIDKLININNPEAGPVEEQIKYRAFELITRQFVTISESTPVTLFLDDVQWADPLSLEFLAYLIRNTEKNRLFILCTARSQELLDDTRPVKTWMRRISSYSSYSQIRLSPLNDIEVRTLIDSIFGNIKISEKVVRRLHEVTQGNPFYLGEVVRQLVQEQKINWVAERWECADLDEIELPGSILELVELRLRRLTDETLEVFSRAAVLGEEFSFQLLHKITELPKNTLMEVIDIGLREFIIKESAASTAETAVSVPFTDQYFIFCHSTLRKVLYERLSGYRRCRLHAQIGDKLENLRVRKLDRASSELAYHFYYGANHRKALYYGVAAGELARNVFAIDEALKYYTWAQESLEQMIECGEEPEYGHEWMGAFRLAYGNVLVHMGRNDAAQAQLEMGLKLSQEADLPALRGKILQTMGELSWSRGDYKGAIEYSESALELLRQSGDIIRESRLFGVMGDTHFSQGLHDQAIEFYNKSLELARQAGDSQGEGEALRRIGSIMGFREQADGALDHLKQALAIARSTGNRQSEWLVMMLIGNIYLYMNELEQSASYYRHSLAIARAIGRRRGECRVSLNMGELCRRLESLHDAKTYFNEAQVIATEIQDRETEGHTLSNLGLVYQDLGEIEYAMDCFQRALGIFRETNYRSHAEAETLLGIACLLLKKGDAAEAKNYFEMALASGRELGLWQLVVKSLRHLADCEHALGQTTARKQCIREALNTIRPIIDKKLNDQEHRLCLEIESELIEYMASLEEEFAS
jgi:eukaryotic-like serine/threonine-protein kinase